MNATYHIRRATQQGLRPAAEDNLPRSARVSDPAETADRRSPEVLETFGRAGGLVGRPSHSAQSPSHSARGRTFPAGLSLLLLGATLLGMPTDVHALCGLDGAVREQLRSVDDPEAVRALTQKIRLHATCSACHFAKWGGPRNEYGSAINTLLKLSDREDPVRQRDAGRRMMDIPANPLLADSPTFGELFQQGRFPARSIETPMPPFDDVSATSRSGLQARPDGSDGPGDPSYGITVEQARELVQKVEADLRFGILQLSRTEEITSEVAEALAEFRGEMLILGLKSLSPEVATALAKSQAANVWLHSVTSVSPEASEAISKLRGHLVLTGLAELDSVPLAEKLAARPGALSFPYLKRLTPVVAAALSKSERRLTLAGLTDVLPEVQEKLAETVGSLSLPSLKSLDSLPLAKKLAASVVLLPEVERLSAEQTELLLGVKGQGSIWGRVCLPLAAVTPEVANVLSRNPSPVNLTLVGKGPLSDSLLRTLLRSRLKLTLRDVEELTAEQNRIAAEALAGTSPTGPLDLPRLSLPSLRKLDSALLAEALGESSGFNFPGVKEISPEAAAALGALPEKEYIGPEMKKIMGPSGKLSFPSLEELSPEVARLLLKKRWISISLPALQEVSLETVRLLARQSARLTLGIPALPFEFAGAFEEAPTEMTLGGGSIVFPYVTDLSPEAARILVKSLNRGVESRGGNVRTSKSPRLIFGGKQERVVAGFPRLSPELAKELAQYEGSLEIQGLGELPAESAAALASFPGPYLVLSGPFSEKLSPAAAESLSKIPGVLRISLRQLDSVPLAARFARQIGWTLYTLETVSREAAPTLCKYKQPFKSRALTVLDSPELARRFVEGTTSGNAITLPALSVLSPEAAEILGEGSKSMYLGLTVLDSAAVARSLSKSRQGVNLPRLRATAPEVIAILKESTSIKTPSLDSLYVVSKSSGRS